MPNTTKQPRMERHLHMTPEELSQQNEATAAELTVLRWINKERTQPRKVKRRWDQRTVGSVKLRLFKKLTAASIPIPSPDCLWCQQGGYRNKNWDLALWGADFQDNKGTFWKIHSWSTMTDCVKYGILIHEQMPEGLEISANGPKRNETRTHE